MTFITVAEAARKLSCSTRTVQRRIADGAFPVFRSGGLVRIDANHLEQWIHNNHRKDT